MEIRESSRTSKASGIRIRVRSMILDTLISYIQWFLYHYPQENGFESHDKINFIAIKFVVIRRGLLRINMVCWDKTLDQLVIQVTELKCWSREFWSGIRILSHTDNFCSQFQEFLWIIWLRHSIAEYWDWLWASLIHHFNPESVKFIKLVLLMTLYGCRKKQILNQFYSVSWPWLIVRLDSEVYEGTTCNPFHFPKVLTPIGILKPLDKLVKYGLETRSSPEIYYFLSWERLSLSSKELGLIAQHKVGIGLLLRRRNLYFQERSQVLIRESDTIFHIYDTFLKLRMAELLLKNKNNTVSPPQTRLKIKIPRIDNSALLARSSKVIMGRCLNPQVQNIDTFIFRMPQFWGLVGKVSGLNLGHGRFQFEFDSEDDLKNVLEYGSTNFDGWMVSYVPWKALADADYPSTINIWIRITGLPFEYRVEEVYKLVVGSLGDIIQIDVGKGKVLFNFPCSKPLIFSSILEFEEGMELKVMFDYKRLEGFCSLCHRMTHSDAVCYKAKKETQISSNSNKPKKGLAVRNKSFKGAILGSISASTSKLSGSLITRAADASKRSSRQTTQNTQNPMSLPNPGVFTSSAGPSKTVRRPLFQTTIEPESQNFDDINDLEEDFTVG